MKKTLAVTISLTLLAFANSAPISIKVSSYKKSVVVNKKGKKHIEWAKPTKVVPKDTIKYVDTIKNSSKDELKGVIVKNKIDKNLLFVANSIKSKAKYSVEFSIDNGKNFAPKDKLYVTGKDGKKHKATAKDYNAIAFKIAKVPSNSDIKISYQAKIK